VNFHHIAIAAIKVEDVKDLTFYSGNSPRESHQTPTKPEIVVAFACNSRGEFSCSLHHHFASSHCSTVAMHYGEVEVPVMLSLVALANKWRY